MKRLLIPLQLAGDVVRKAEDFENACKKRFGFQPIPDWEQYRACVDLPEDAE